MKFQLPLLAVRDVEVSKRFYAALFGQEVVQDFGINVTFSGGFAIQQSFGWLIGKDESEICWRPQNMELYFEEEDLDAFLEKLQEFPEAELVHPPKTHGWGQRVVRLYDPDGHILEVGEPMTAVVRRLLREGKSPEEAARITTFPLEAVRKAAEELH